MKAKYYAEFGGDYRSITTSDGEVLAFVSTCDNRPTPDTDPRWSKYCKRHSLFSDIEKQLGISVAGLSRNAPNSPYSGGSYWEIEIEVTPKAREVCARFMALIGQGDK